ncbi:MAG: hypothetical protein ACOC1F_07625 [Myxococcota bacterium]
MEIRCDAIIPFPRPLVYATYRDKLHELLPYLPNIRDIVVKERREEDGVVHLVNVWHGGGEVPGVARAFVSESMLSWTDLATWNEASFTTDWKVQPHSFQEAVTSQGTNVYTESDGKTRLEIRGDLTIDAKKIKGVPRMLAGKVSRAVEDFMVKRVGQNLLDVSKGVTRYLEDQR